jgi:outer membrane PBP1 activator LpoA protein
MPSTRQIVYRRVIAVCLTALLTASCAVQPTQPRDIERATLQKLKEIESTGDYQRIAREYNKLAALVSPPRRQDYQLDAAAALVKGNFISQAKRIIDGLPDSDLTVDQYLRRQLLAARIAMAEHQPDQTLATLAIRLPPDTPDDLQAQFHGLRADAYTSLGKPLDAVRELIAREPHLTDPDAVVQNQQTLWRGLTQLPDDMLTAALPSATPVLKGWLELAAIARHDQGQLGQAIAAWQARYPDHPAGKQILEVLLARQAVQAIQPAQIALLLPLSGTYTGPAQALRDGFLLAHYTHGDSEHKPEIRVYDVGENPDDIVSYYNQAVSDGAQFVVGPLSKQAVVKLMSSATITVPTLTLNFAGQDVTPPANLYQISLSPEDEARQVAERAWLDGHNQAISLVPAGDWGDRVFAAFKQHWEALGGTILQAQTFNAQASDFSSALRMALDLDESQARRDALVKLLGQDLDFQPRRRQDADLVFMAAFPRQARLIRPQLEFNYAADLPVYATSHVYSGTVDQNADRDLDDVIFCDMPWVLAGGDKRSALRNKVTRLWPDQSEQYTRFYALGIDAYNVIPRINELRQFPYEEYPGQTGYLTLGQDGRFHRRLLWARIVDGVPKLIDAIIPAQP